MRWLLFLMIILAAGVIQTSLADLAAIGPAKPDLLIALVVFLAFQFDLHEVFLPIWALGIFRDVFSASPFGVYGLIFLGVGVFVSLVRQFAFRDSVVAVIALTTMSVALCETLALCVLSMKYRVPYRGSIVASALFSGIYSSAIALALPALLKRPCRWMSLGRE